MKINKIRISNILGIDHLEFEPGQITEISGKNGSGKTSILEAVKNSLKGGTDATLLRKGAKSGEIVLVLDDGLQIQKSITETKSELNLYDRAGMKIQKPQNYLNQLFDLLSVNPVQFLTAEKKNRVAYLLESLPFELPADKLAECLKGIESADINFNFVGHPLEVLAGIHTAIFTERREINRASKEKLSAVNQLKETMVEYDFSPEAIEGTIKELEGKSQTWREKKDNYLMTVMNEHTDKREKARLEYEKTIDEISFVAEQKKSEIQSAFDANHNPLIEQIAKLREQQKQIGAAMKTKELIGQYETESNNLVSYSEKLSNSLSKLDDLKGNLLSSLPVKGLEIIDGEIYCDGIVFDRLNTAKQVQLAVEVAKLRAGTLGLICVDGLEKLDQEQYASFKSEAEKSGLQLIITKVDNNELTIK